MRRTHFRAAVALLASLGAAVQAESLPQWLIDAQARELPVPAPAPVASEDGWFRTQVPGGLRHKVVKEEGSYSLEIALNGSVTVDCEVIPKALNAAAYLKRVAELSFERIAKGQGQIEARALEASDAGVVGVHPFMSLRWIYRTNRDGERRVGGLKQFFADLGPARLYCANDDVGYVRSFEAVAHTVARHLQVTAAAPLAEPYFREVSVVSLDGTRVGVVLSTMTRDADGDTELRNRTAMLVQPAPGELLAQDTSDIEWLRPDGSLINAVQVKRGNGELTEDLALKLQDGSWQVSGTLRGKPIEAALAEAPSSYVQHAKARQGLMAQAKAVGAQAEAKVWSSLDPTRLLPTRVTLLAAVGGDAYAAREELGDMALEAVLDRRTGTVRSLRMPLGARTLQFERVLVQGAF